MEEESFESEAVARVLNEHFISIKVDREERPDLDEIYMTATQLIRRRGGWPNSVFLTPDLKPFYAGTYFPEEQFIAVAEQLSATWRMERDRVEETAEQVFAAMRQVSVSQRGDVLPTRALVDSAVSRLKETYDHDWGGFGPAPKFPSPASLALIHERGRKGDAEARQMLVETLLSMGRGAIYDHIDGGFHRYSVDREWRVPHFEKMLYDNALIGDLLVHASLEDPDPELTRLARGTLGFIVDHMRLDSGGFLSAIDAQTDGQEGAYYIWTDEELRATLSESEHQTLSTVFPVNEAPNFEGHYYTLFMTAPLAEIADRRGTSRGALLEQLNPVLTKLRSVRDKREFPLIDEKVLTDWNAMAISALANGGRHLEEPRFLEAAGEAARFLLTHSISNEGTLQHTFRGEAKIDAFLDDYAYLARALIDLYDASGDTQWLREAERIAEEGHRRLAAEGGGYFMSSHDAFLLFKPRNVYDNAIPSANAVMIGVLLRLGELTSKPFFRTRVESSLKAFQPELASHPASVKMLALVTEYYLDRFSVPTGPRRTITATPMEELALSVVRAEARMLQTSDDSIGKLVVHIEIEPGWHVNANPASLDYLIPLQILGDVVNLQYPEGDDFTFAFSDQALKVYEGALEVSGEISRDRGSIRLRYQACDDERCLAPVEQTVEVEGAQ